MLKQVAEAIDRQDYETADHLLQAWKQEEIDNPWVVFYDARLEEVTGHFELASQKYRELLQQSANPKLIGQIRQGIGRLSEIEAQHQLEVKKHRLAAMPQARFAHGQAKLEPGSHEPGILILEPIPSEEKQQAARQFARVMQLDFYTARLQLPSRAWRLYRSGTIGELRVLVETLKEVNIPCFSATLKDIHQLNVYQVDYFEEVFPVARVVCHTSHGPQEVLEFDWSELSGRVEGMLPIFEECVEMGIGRKMERKTKTSDYVQVCDLHLKERHLILRLCDRTYKFHQGIAFCDRQTAEETTTSRDNWNHLIFYFAEQFFNRPVWTDFTPFAEAAIDFSETLKSIQPHLDLLRREDTPWDNAFHLFSTLAFLKEKS